MWCTCLLARIFAYLHGFNHLDSIPLTCVQCSDLLAQCIAYLQFYATPTCIPTCIAYTHVHFSNFHLIRGFSDTTENSRTYPICKSYIFYLCAQSRYAIYKKQTRSSRFSTWSNSVKQLISLLVHKKYYWIGGPQTGAEAWDRRKFKRVKESEDTMRYLQATCKLLAPYLHPTCALLAWSIWCTWNIYSYL